MNDRFSPEWGKVEPCLDRLIRELGGEEHLLENSLRAVAKAESLPTSALDVKTFLHGIVITPGLPWVLYDTISHLLTSSSPPMRRQLAQLISIETSRNDERLQVTQDGRWQVAWQLSQAADPEDRFVALDWYVPDERDRVPIVPLPIIDYVAGSISLLRSNLPLPAAATLLIALESALWEDLAAKGISRTSERITYAPVAWNFKVFGGKLVVTVQGSDSSLQDLPKQLGPRHMQGHLESRRLRDEGGTAVLRVALSQELASYLTTETEESRESFPEKGLAEAVQRARNAGILMTFPIQLDETLYRLRNALIHLPADDQIDPPVPLPGGNSVKSLIDLRRNPRFIRDIALLVTNLINQLYATR